MSTGGRPIEKVQEVVVRDIDEKLRPSRLRSSRVGHTESARFVGNLGHKFIRNTSVAVASVLRPIAGEELGARRWPAGAGSVRIRILGIGTPELVHEIGNDSVEMNTVIETRVGQIDEVATVRFAM